MRCHLPRKGPEVPSHPIACSAAPCTALVAPAMGHSCHKAAGEPVLLHPTRRGGRSGWLSPSWGPAASCSSRSLAPHHLPEHPLSLLATCLVQSHWCCRGAPGTPCPRLAGACAPTPRTDPLFGSAFSSALQSAAGSWPPGCGLSGPVGRVTPSNHPSP